MLRGMFCLLDVTPKTTIDNKSYTHIGRARFVIIPYGIMILTLIKRIDFVQLLTLFSRGKFAGEIRWPTIDRSVTTIGTRHHTRVITSAVQ